MAADWAAAEGWNPGLGDAEAFHGVDPSGFLMGWLGDVPVSAISVVRHSERFGFLGFYLCRAEHRGMGHGMATWQAGMAHLGGRTVGLDGVPAQEANYQRSGFVLAHHTKRYAGLVDARPDPEIRPATEADIPELVRMDRQIGGTERHAYISAWFGPAETRRTLVHDAGGVIRATGTIRECRNGHKIGPIFAPDAEIARRLIGALVHHSGAKLVMIDVPDPNEPGVALARSLGLEPVFSCARMYKGAPLVRRTGNIFAETTFELG